MLHEAYSETSLTSRTTDRQKYFRSFHVSSRELAAEATKGRPGLLVLYHQMYWPPTTEEQLLEEVKTSYAGKVASAHDLDVY